jgi:DMSO/TMAO reductase YedYZ molybdopterin-dependent catalytic subunit
VHSLEQAGSYNQVTLSSEVAGDPHTLLALSVNGTALSLDHGYPARLIAPGLPGVHCTKWVQQIIFREVSA